MSAHLKRFAAAAAAGPLASCTGWQSALAPRSGEAETLKQLFIVFLIAAAVVWTAVMVAMLAALWRRRDHRGQPPLRREVRPLLAAHLWLIALAVFTAGWSLLWASGLRLITFLPLSAGPLLMLAGLGLFRLSLRNHG